MSHSPAAWKRLGILFQDARQRQGMSRKAFADVAGISEKAVYNAETGDAHVRVPPTYAKYAAALNWTPESVHAVLNGGDPSAQGEQSESESPPRSTATRPEEPTLLLLLTRVHEFGRLAVSLGADGAIRDELDATAQRLVQSIPQNALRQTDVGLAAYRPHAPGEGPANDDAERILRAMEEHDRNS